MSDDRFPKAEHTHLVTLVSLHAMSFEEVVTFMDKLAEAGGVAPARLAVTAGAASWRILASEKTADKLWATKEPL